MGTLTGGTWGDVGRMMGTLMTQRGTLGTWGYVGDKGTFGIHRYRVRRTLGWGHQEHEDRKMRAMDMGGRWGHETEQWGLWKGRGRGDVGDIAGGGQGTLVTWGYGEGTLGTRGRGTLQGQAGARGSLPGDVPKGRAVSPGRRWPRSGVGGAEGGGPRVGRSRGWHWGPARVRGHHGDTPMAPLWSPPLPPLLVLLLLLPGGGPAGGGDTGSDMGGDTGGDLGG